MNLPPQWDRCPRKGDLVADLFLPFKTPLDSRYENQLEPCQFFTPEMLILSMKKIKNICLWIDLTNTNRYYNEEIVKKHKIAYAKFKMKGREQAPTEQDTDEFIRLCDSFISRNPFSIIAIHCTHGFNRTGFLICAYLINKLDWAVDAALRTFSTCRSPGIYKEDYILELFKRYDPETSELEAKKFVPLRPAWRDEQEENLDHDDVDPQTSHNEDNQILKNRSQFMNGINGIEFVSDKEKSDRLQKKVQKLCHFNKQGFPGSQPVSMSHENLNFIERSPYLVSWKADGTRYMMLIEGENQIYLFDRDFSVFEIVDNCPKFPRRKQPDEHIIETLLDGEMVIDVVNNVQYPRYLIYDIVTFEGQDVGGTIFTTRSICIHKEIVSTREEAKKTGRIDRSQELIGIRQKDFWNIKSTRKIFNMNMAHEVDGLIFQPVNEIYKAGQCLSILKWKPPTHNSIDFRVRIIKEEQPGCLPETWACLMVGRENTMMAKIKATKEFRENDNKIIECSWDFDLHTWKFMRVRTDKSYPNSRATAEAVWKTISTPLTKDQLLSFIENRGFQVRGQKRPYSSR